jgi:hypothetical protein
VFWFPYRSNKKNGSYISFQRGFLNSIKQRLGTSSILEIEMGEKLNTKTKFYLLNWFMKKLQREWMKTNSIIIQGLM